MSYVAEERKKHTVYPPAEHVFTWTQMCDVHDVGSGLMADFFYYVFAQLSGMATHAKKKSPDYFMISAKGKYPGDI